MKTIKELSKFKILFDNMDITSSVSSLNINTEDLFDKLFGIKEEYIPDLPTTYHSTSKNIDIPISRMHNFHLQNAINKSTGLIKYALEKEAKRRGI